MRTIAICLLVYQGLILAYFLFLGLGYSLITAFAFLFIRDSADASPDARRIDDIVSLGNMRPVSVLIPAFNEEINIVATLRSAAQLRYPDFEIIVVNDGSTDATLERIRAAFTLLPVDRPPKKQLETAPVRGVYRSVTFPHIWVVDKENGGKADSLNAALSFSNCPLFCAIDADSILERDGLLRVGHQFFMDKELIAAGAAVRVLNGCRVEGASVVDARAPSGVMANIQIAEYLRGFMAGRVAFSSLDSLLIISGAFGVFRKDLVLAIQGFRKTVGEDMDLVLRLHRHCVDNKIPYKVRFLPEPACWTQVPSDLPSLLRQRNRWQRGLVDSLWHNKVMLFNPKYGNAGLIGMPYFFLIEMLGPLVELTGYVGFVIFFMLHMLNFEYAELFFLLALTWGMWLNTSAVLLDNFIQRKYRRIRDSYKIALFGSFEYLGYRQLVAVERIIGTFRVWQSHWGIIHRKEIREEGEGVTS